MNARAEELKRNGFVILRDVVPPNRLEELRSSFETLVERQKQIWARDRKAGDPPGGAWETSRQPRLRFSDLIDSATANTVEFCLGETTFGVSKMLMGAPDAAITAIYLMCSPVRDHGPAEWHRDVSAGHPAPLRALIQCIQDYGPSYIQWNIALYDDSVLWVVPGSHLRPNTEEENRQMAENPRVPLPNSIPAELRSGDGVAYALPILHWASNYSARLRRIIHLGYRSFGKGAFSYVHWRHWDPEFVPMLSPPARQTFERFERQWQAEHDVIESIYRAILDSNPSRFEENLALLHSGKTGRMTSVVMLCKLAFMMQEAKKLEEGSLPPAERTAKLKAHWFGCMLFYGLARRFTPSEADELCRRFAPLDAKLKFPEPKAAPGFQRGASPYNPNDLPQDFTLEDFIASWKN